MKVALASDALHIEYPFTDEQFVLELNGFAPQHQTSPTKIAIRFYPSGSAEQDSVLALARELHSALGEAITRHDKNRQPGHPGPGWTDITF